MFRKAGKSENIHGKELEYKLKYGASSKEPFKSAWPWYTSLTWLNDHFCVKKMHQALLLRKSRWVMVMQEKAHFPLYLPTKFIHDQRN